MSSEQNFPWHADPAGSDTSSPEITEPNSPTSIGSAMTAQSLPADSDSEGSSDTLPDSDDEQTLVDEDEGQHGTDNQPAHTEEPDIHWHDTVYERLRNTLQHWMELSQDQRDSVEMSILQSLPVSPGSTTPELHTDLEVSQVINAVERALRDLHNPDQ